MTKVYTYTKKYTFICECAFFFVTLQRKSLATRKIMKAIVLFILAIVLAVPAKANVEVGAEQTKQYLPLLQGKRVALLSNHTGIVVKGEKGKEKGDTIHTLDLLLKPQRLRATLRA